MRHENLFVVTGGSRGIGAAVARLAAKTYPVVIMYRENADAAHRLVHEIHAHGGQAWALQADVGDEASLLRALEQIDELGQMAVLVNNAGVTGGVSRLADLKAGNLSEVFRVNVVGAFVAAREAVKRMSTARGGKGGVIINISSGASVLGSPNTWIHYASSKGALDTMTIGLSKEVAREGVRVNAVRPGIIDTELHQQRTPEALERFASTIPMGRMGTADEVAESVVWLASPAASYVTGCLMDVRGGL
ncbi:NAD(P)-dependent dehydrogenase (short-subunit alcohol dehydrogenase family) [Paraburkholderia sp. BL23I1N1]|uniref:SDR family oxidoreductase n=1 Tax=Paraburkholderia sp. BL23I1N1 TaxID=1938802 RepID=UPI000E714C27|nr:SDR family oxidoreductase [Paraburkholderia sp. BL23I1N1]RKE38658.1 NAD(P)-dependent dehydrogenase (short-subunit alcohol dehydrogenase family) [Paraburkholderia sp. BL23I1N1]